jgi:DNA-binding transcriptional LysR family regulator
MELRHLRYFVAVAELLHFGRAAVRLQIAQPSLSHQIRQLEAELQSTLLDRTKRRVRLTEAGGAFLEEARAILAHADRAAVIARLGSHGEHGRVRIALAYWIDPTRIIAAIESFNGRHPAVRIEMRRMAMPSQIAALQDEKLDVGFVRAPIGDDALASDVLAREPLVVALPASHRLAARRRVFLSALAAESFVLVPRDSLPVFFDLVFETCRNAGFIPRALHDADHPSMVLGLVAAGLGISLVPASAQANAPRGVVFRTMRPSSPIVQTVVAWRRNASPLVDDFVKAVQANHVR